MSLLQGTRVLTFKGKGRGELGGYNQQFVCTGECAPLFCAGNGDDNEPNGSSKAGIFNWGGWLVLGCAHNSNKISWICRIQANCLLPVPDVPVILDSKYV